MLPSLAQLVTPLAEIMQKDSPTLHLAVRQVLAAYMLGAASTKSVQGAADHFTNQLTRFAIDAWEGGMDKVDFQRAMRALLKEDAEDVYIEGMIEGGYEDETEARENMDEADSAAIADFYTEQSGFVGSFAADVLEVKTAENKTQAQQAIFDRIDVWANSLSALGATGRASAQKNEMGEWEYGPTEHCPTCERLNGQRHRMKWWVSKGYIPRQPGSAMLECKGFNCQCRIKNDKDETIL